MAQPNQTNDPGRDPVFGTRTDFMSRCIRQIQKNSVDWTELQNPENGTDAQNCSICFEPFVFDRYPILPDYVLPPEVQAYRAMCLRLHRLYWARNETCPDLDLVFPGLSEDAIHYPIMLRCGHVFGLLCILNYNCQRDMAPASKCCPLCRTPIFDHFTRAEFYVDDGPQLPIEFHPFPQRPHISTRVNLLNAPSAIVRYILDQYMPSRKVEFFLYAYSLMQTSNYTPRDSLLNAMYALASEVVPMIQRHGALRKKLAEINEDIRRSNLRRPDGSELPFGLIQVQGYPPSRPPPAQHTPPEIADLSDNELINIPLFILYYPDGMLTAEELPYTGTDTDFVLVDVTELPGEVRMFDNHTNHYRR
jgi:hypothetical protein